jgi:hypothetical protein
MSPFVRDELMPEIPVDVISTHDWDLRSTRARLVRCPKCGREYDAMRWGETAPGEPVLICACGMDFPMTRPLGWIDGD